ncbi:MAG: hypothetical protein IPK32_01990 [Verrucomicrobiaceae bacterium]|nr:hypothetical protein [Verrucomicrobiaceae bacterium]
MPEEAAAGCLVGLLRFFAFAAEFVLEWCGEWFLGYIGKWTLYALSLGHRVHDHEEGVCICTGILVCVGLIWLGVWLL